MPIVKAEFRDKALFVRLFGRNVHAVGGYVRDIIMGKPPAEVDLLVTGLPLDEVIRRMRTRSPTCSTRGPAGVAGEAEAAAGSAAVAAGSRIGWPSDRLMTWMFSALRFLVRNSTAFTA